VNLESILAGAVAGGTSILYPTLGEVIAERSGVINLGTEGSMLCGALAAYAVGVETGNPWLGVLAGLVAGALIAMVHAYVVLLRGANQLATGLVVSFLGLGLTSLFGQDYVGRGVEALTDWDVPGLSGLPFFGRVLFQHDPLTYLSIVAAVAAWWALRRTRAGVRLRAAGERPEVLSTFGSSPVRVRFLAVTIGGALAGLGGAQLSTAFTRNWSEGMTAGRGYIAVGLTIFAAWDPLKAIAGAYLFSGAEALQLQLQAEGTSLSPFLLQAFPYVVVILVLAVLSGRRLGLAPEALSRVFEGRAA
jgi:simple sugar transport system permease protein